MPWWREQAYIDAMADEPPAQAVYMADLEGWEPPIRYDEPDDDVMPVSLANLSGMGFTVRTVTKEG